MPDSVSTLLQTNFAAHARERAYGQRQGYRMAWFTYGQVSDLAFRFVRQLEARQITKGDRVMLWGQNSAEWVATFFGCVISGVARLCPQSLSAGRVEAPGVRAHATRAEFALRAVKLGRFDP